MPGVGTLTHTHTHYFPGKVDIEGTIQSLEGGEGS